MICFAAKWNDKPRIMFHSEFHDGREEMVSRAHSLLDEADIVVHWNGKSFDVPHLQREFLVFGLKPPSPFKQIDLMKVVKKEFRFPSNKLDYVAQQLLGKAKVSHTGHNLWMQCLQRDPKAWALMKKYNREDVRLTDELYEYLRPWIKGHPHVGLYLGDDVDRCSNCGSEDLERRGFAHTAISTFQQYRCRECGSWSRSGKAVARVDVRGQA